jgi:hypothetical protein
MAFTLNESMLPATLTLHPITDEELAELCRAPGLVL